MGKLDQEYNFLLIQKLGSDIGQVGVLGYFILELYVLLSFKNGGDE